MRILKKFSKVQEARATQPSFYSLIAKLKTRASLKTSTTYSILMKFPIYSSRKKKQKSWKWSEQPQDWKEKPLMALPNSFILIL